jgi:hypothetical protein
MGVVNREIAFDPSPYSQRYTIEGRHDRLLFTAVGH